MKQFTAEGIQDLWEDWTRAIQTERMDLRSTLICQVKAIRKKNVQEDVAELLITSPKTMSQRMLTDTVPHSLAGDLKRTGFFLQAAGRRYLPTDMVKKQCLYDYFQINADRAPNSFTSPQDLLYLASMFRNTARIGFVSKHLCKGFRLLVGMKGSSADNLGAAVPGIARAVAEKSGAKFYSAYTEQEAPGLTFDVLCAPGNSRTRDGIPLSILLSDNATARKSMRIVIVADLDSRLFRLGNMDISHRLTLTDKDLAEETLELLHKYENMELDTEVPYAEVFEAISPYVPKRSLEKFGDFMSGSHQTPLLAAYDAMDTVIFGRFDRQYRTRGYDGGRGAYEVALGKLLMKSVKRR